MTDTDRGPVVRLTFLVKLGILVVVLFGLFLVFCGGGEAEAATLDETGETTTYTLSPLSADRQCYGWEFGPWVNRDGAGNLRFGYGEDLVACTNPRGTRWVEVPTFQPYHWLGYWDHRKTTKERSALGYGTLNIQTNWKFEWDPGFGLPVLHKERTLRCSLAASNHTASCTLYYN